jgi:transcription antitermination factor NusG
VLKDKQNEIQHAGGVVGLVRFGEKIPEVPDAIIEELKECFKDDAPMLVENCFSPGDEVKVMEGVFCEAQAFVLKVMPARKRVQVLLDILGRPTPVEVDFGSVVRERSLAELAPSLAARSDDGFNLRPSPKMITPSLPPGGGCWG